MAYYARKHGNREQKLGDGLQKSTQITALKQRLLEIGREANFFALPRQGTPSKMSDELTTEVKSME